MTFFPRKTLAVGLAAISLGAFVAADATPAAAQWHGGWGPGAVAAGVIGGVAVGALAAGALAPPAYAYGPPVVYAPPPCWFERQPVYDYYGRVAGYRRIRVCR